MAEDWAADVKKYAPDANDAVIAAIVRYCGIALRSRDASLVSFTDPVETARVRDNFCRKKLGLTQSDADVDAAIARVGARMGGDRTRNRVTVYYLLAEAFGKLELFAAGAAAATPAIATMPGAPLVDVIPSAAAPAPATVAATPLFAAAAAPRFTAPATVAAAPARRWEGERPSDPMVSTALIAAAVMGAIILGTAMLGSQIAAHIGGKAAATPVSADPPPDYSAAPKAAPAVPAGADVPGPR